MEVVTSYAATDQGPSCVSVPQVTAAPSLVWTSTSVT